MIDIGTQAIAGIGRRISITGMNKSRTRWYLPITSPSGTPIDDRDHEAEQDAPHADDDVDEILVRQPDLVSCCVHLIGRRNVLEADVEFELVFGAEIPDQEQGPIEMHASDAVMIRSRVTYPSRSRNTLRSETVGIGSGAGTTSSVATGAGASGACTAETFARPQPPAQSRLCLIDASI